MKITKAYITSYDKSYHNSNELRVFASAEVVDNYYSGWIDFEFSYDPESTEFDEVRTLSTEIDFDDLEEDEIEHVEKWIEQYIRMGRLTGLEDLADLESDEDY